MQGGPAVVIGCVGVRARADEAAHTCHVPVGRRHAQVGGGRVQEFDEAVLDHAHGVGAFERGRFKIGRLRVGSRRRRRYRGQWRRQLLAEERFEVDPENTGG